MIFKDLRFYGLVTMLFPTGKLLMVTTVLAIGFLNTNGSWIKRKDTNLAQADTCSCPCPSSLFSEMTLDSITTFAFSGMTLNNITMSQTIEVNFDVPFVIADQLVYSLEVGNLGQISVLDDSVLLDTYYNEELDYCRGSVEIIKVDNIGKPDQINEFIQCETDQEFTGSSALIVRWENTGSRMGGECINMDNTFQTVVITNGTSTYWINKYEKLEDEGSLEYDSGLKSPNTVQQRQGPGDFVDGGCNGSYVFPLGRGSCVSPKTLNLTHMVKGVNEIDVYKYGEVSTLQCDSGYRVVIDSDSIGPLLGGTGIEITCMGDNQWDNMVEIPGYGVGCEYPSCQVPENLNMSFMSIIDEADAYARGEVLTLQCFDGYNMVNGSKDDRLTFGGTQMNLTCLGNNDWNNLVPVENFGIGCEYSYCLLEELTMTNTREIDHENRYDNGEVLTVQCVYGYTIITSGNGSSFGETQMNLTCLGMKQWTDFGLACEDPSCQLPEALNMSFMSIIEEVDAYARGDVLTLQCYDGYNFVTGFFENSLTYGVTQMNLTCLGDNQWNTPVPVENYGIGCEYTGECPNANEKLVCDICGSDVPEVCVAETESEPANSKLCYTQYKVTNKGKLKIKKKKVPTANNCAKNGWLEGDCDQSVMNSGDVCEECARPRCG